MSDVLLERRQLLLVGDSVLLEGRQGRLVLLLQLPLLEHLKNGVRSGGEDQGMSQEAGGAADLLLQLLVKLLQLLQLSQLLRVLLQSLLELALLGALAVDLAGGLGLGPLRGRDVGQGPARGDGQAGGGGGGDQVEGKEGEDEDEGEGEAEGEGECHLAIPCRPAAESGGGGWSGSWGRHQEEILGVDAQLRRLRRS